LERFPSAVLCGVRRVLHRNRKYPDEDNPGTCLVPGNNNITWFVFTVITSGDLAFAITPEDPTADYDWSLTISRMLRVRYTYE